MTPKGARVIVASPPTRAKRALSILTGADWQFRPATVTIAGPTSLTVLHDRVSHQHADKEGDRDQHQCQRRPDPHHPAAYRCDDDARRRDDHRDRDSTPRHQVSRIERRVVALFATRVG